MSASEKLKALWNLDAQRYQNGAIDQDAIKAANRHVDALVAATPQMVAVVEATEHLIFDNGTRSRQQMWRDAEAALSALDEALEEADSGDLHSAP